MPRSTASWPAHGQVTPHPTKRPKSSYIRFEAEQPNESWQSDFTHYRAPTDGADVEIITWLDDHSRYALHVSAHPRVTAPIVLDHLPHHRRPARHPRIHAHRQRHGLHRPARRRPRRPHRLRTRTPPPATSCRRTPDPNHPTTCGKAERFQQTLKKWLRAQPVQPATIADLQTLIDHFIDEYNHRPPAPLTAPPRHPGHRLHTPAQSRPRRHPGQPTPTTASATTDQQRRHRHPARRRPTAPHRHRPNPTPEPTSSCSSRTSTSASSTPPPANSSANSPSTHAATTNPPADHPDPPKSN